VAFETGTHPGREFIQHHLADIVPVALVLCARVSKANDEPGISHESILGWGFAASGAGEGQ
jgi:hypothetical protein